MRREGDRRVWGGKEEDKGIERGERKMRKNRKKWRRMAGGRKWDRG